MELVWHMVSWLDTRSLARVCRVERRMRGIKQHFDWFPISARKFAFRGGGGERRQRNHHALVHRTGTAVLCASMPVGMDSGMALGVVSNRGRARVLYERGWCIDMDHDGSNYAIQRLHHGTVIHISPACPDGSRLYAVDMDALDEVRVYSTNDPDEALWNVTHPSFTRYEVYPSGPCVYTREDACLVMSKPDATECVMRSCAYPNYMFYVSIAEQSISPTPWGVLAIEGSSRKLHFSHHDSCFMYPLSDLHVAYVSAVNFVTSTVVADEYTGTDVTSSRLTVYNVASYPPQPVHTIRLPHVVASLPVACVGPCFMWREFCLDEEGTVTKHMGDPTFKPQYACGVHYLVRGGSVYCASST